MKPSLNALALVRAFDLNTPPAMNKEEYIFQSRLFLDAVAPYSETISELFSDSQLNDQTKQNRFDALTSIAYDVGLELLLDSPLAKLAHQRASRTLVNTTFASIPSFEDTLRDETRIQLLKYRLPILSRRGFEAELFCGNVFFSFGKTLDNSGNIVYAPSVLHPMIRFLMATAMR